MIIPILNACGNIFIFINENQWPLLLARKNPPYKDLSHRVADLCENLGSGADGLVLVKKTSEENLDFVWEFYNKDGSSAEMCGNAARCMAAYVRDYLGFRNSQVRFQTLAGPVSVSYLPNGEFAVEMPSSSTIVSWLSETLSSGSSFTFAPINTGVPHAVVQVDHLQESGLTPFIEKLRFHSSFGEAGANVSFFQKIEDFKLRGVTFERGVEGFTASCGTGVTAMALAHAKRLEKPPGSSFLCEVETPGGNLVVEKNIGEDFCWLRGPAILLEEIELIESSKGM